MAKKNEKSPVQVQLETLTNEDIANAIGRLTPERLAQIRGAAEFAGFKQEQGVRKLPNGSLQFTLTLPAEVAEPLIVWAETAQEPLKEFVEKIGVDAITSFVFADMGGAPAAEPSAVPPPAPVAVAAGK